MTDQEIIAALTDYRTKMDAAFAAMETKNASLHAKYEASVQEIDKLNAQLKLSLPLGGAEHKSLGQRFIEAEQFKAVFSPGWSRTKASVTLEQKLGVTTTTVGGYGTPGVLPYQATGYIQPARQRLFLRDLLPVIPATAGVIQAIKQTSFTNAASPQTEALAKAESDAEFEVYYMPVQTIAHFITATRQVLDDWPQLRAIIDTDMTYFLKLKEEQELLSGTGTGQHLHGLTQEATAFSTALLGSGSWNKADVLRRAIEQLENTFFDADTMVVNPTDWADIELTKTTGTASSGEYVIGDPKASLPRSLWGKNLVVTPAITAGTFLVGAFQIGAAIYDRMATTIDVSTEYSDYFAKNKVAIRAEERLALVTKYGEAFIYGSFSTSPA